MEAFVTYVEGLQFVGSASSGHAIVIDGDAAVGGGNTGLNPSELLLIALGSCSAMGAVSILKKKQQDVSGFEVRLRGDKAGEWPRQFTGISLEFTIKGNGLSAEAVRRSLELAIEKYCTVKATLAGSPEIAYDFKIIEEDRAIKKPGKKGGK